MFAPDMCSGEPHMWIKDTLGIGSDAHRRAEESIGMGPVSGSGEGQLGRYVCDKVM